MAPSDAAARARRVELIKQIEERRGSKVISYVTSDRQNLSVQIAADVVSILHEHILAAEDGDTTKVDLFLYSRGGASDVPWTIVSMFRAYAEKGSFSVLIPYRAHSATTLISLGADEIVMTKKAELGPIDITMGSGPYNPVEPATGERLPISVEDVTGYFSLLEKVGCERPEEKLKGFENLTDKVHPLALGRVSRLLEETKLVASRLLSTRAEPFPEEENRRIVRALSSEIYSHNHAISRTEARDYIGLKQVKTAEDCGIAADLWALYQEYNALFQLEQPFGPEEELIKSGQDEIALEGLKLACIESSAKFSLCQKSMRIRKIRQVPPTVNINVGNIQLPPVTIPNLPPDFTMAQLQELVRASVQEVAKAALGQAANGAAESLKKLMPHAGFERVDYDAGWTHHDN